MPRGAGEGGQVAVLRLAYPSRNNVSQHLLLLLYPNGQVKAAGLSKPSVLDAKRDPCRYTEQKFQQDALVGKTGLVVVTVRVLCFLGVVMRLRVFFFRE